MQYDHDPNAALLSTYQTFYLRNWPPYGQPPPQRGVLILWFDEAIAQARPQPQRTGRRGRPFIHDTAAVQCMLMLQAFYHLPLRQAQLLMAGVTELAQIAIRVPNYSTLSRRRLALTVQLPRHDQHEPVHLVLDTPGLSVYNDAAWYAHVRTLAETQVWRRVRIEVDDSTNRIVARRLEMFHGGAVQ
jgi:hypothetical protein